MSLAAKAFAAMCIPGDTAKNKGQTTPDCIERFDDIQYGADPKWNVLDVYRRKDLDGKLPVLIDIHGGGWVYGDKELYQFYCMEMATHGFAVVNFTYGLAPQFKHPSSMIDMNNVVKFVFENAETYGFDTSKIFFAGDSAGAHMACLYADICTDPEYAKNYPFEVPEGFVPTAMLLNCGAYEMDSLVGKAMKLLIKDLVGHKPTDADKDLLTPIRHINEKFPPCYIMTAILDPLRFEAKYLTRTLDAVGVPYTFKIYGDRKHLISHVFHCDPRLDIAHECNKEEANYLKTFC